MQSLFHRGVVAAEAGDDAPFIGIHLVDDGRGDYDYNDDDYAQHESGAEFYAPWASRSYILVCH